MTRRSAERELRARRLRVPRRRASTRPTATHAPSRRAGRTQSRVQLTQAIAAVRESFEELGVLLAHHGDGRPVDGRRGGRHGPQHRGNAFAFAEQCAARGLRLATDQVYTLAHWITDRDLPKRFDVPFLVARMPEGQIAVWPTRPSSSSPAGCARPMRWRATRRAASS